MRTLLLFLLVVVTGCATVYTTAELVAIGKTRNHTSVLSPAMAAGCVARGLEAATDVYETNVRAGPAEGSYEVVVRVPVFRDVPNQAVIRIEPSGSGSRIIMHMRPEVSDETTDKVARFAFEGC